MKKLGKFFTSIIKKGRKPWGIDPKDIELFRLDFKWKDVHIWYMDYSSQKKWMYELQFKTFRELVSLESGLRQFVCKNKLQWEWWERALNVSVWQEELNAEARFHHSTPEFRFIQSALIPENKIAEFLVKNIVLCDVK